MPFFGLALVIAAGAFTAGSIAHDGWCWSGCAAQGDYTSTIIGMVFGVGMSLCLFHDVMRFFR